MKIIKINKDNSVSVVYLAKDADAKKEAKRIGGMVYKKDIPSSDFLKFEQGKVVIDKQAQNKSALKAKLKKYLVKNEKAIYTTILLGNESKKASLQMQRIKILKKIREVKDE